MNLLDFIGVKGKKYKASFDVRAFYSAPACLHQGFIRRNPFFFFSVHVCDERVWRGCGEVSALIEHFTGKKKKKTE